MVAEIDYITMDPVCPRCGGAHGIEIAGDGDEFDCAACHGYLMCAVGPDGGAMFPWYREDGTCGCNGEPHTCDLDEEQRAQLLKRSGNGFHTATICADCDPPVVAISTGYGSRCPRCGQVEEGAPTPARPALPDGALARKVLVDTAVRSDSDAYLLAELARRLLEHAGTRVSAMEVGAIAAGAKCKIRIERCVDGSLSFSGLPAGDYEVVRLDSAIEEVEDDRVLRCPYCLAGKPSVWDSVLEHYAHPHAVVGKLTFCDEPWRARCRRCSANPGACTCDAVVIEEKR